MKYFVIGNSHVNQFNCNGPPNTDMYCDGNFRGVSIGPIIAYNFYENHLPKVYTELNTHNVKPSHESETLILVVGEVDCRWHIPKQAELQKRDIADVASECAKRYFRAPLKLFEDGYNVIIWGAHPSTSSGHNDNESCPVYGDMLTRNKIAKIFNATLENLCIDSGLQFKSIYNKLVNEIGETKMEYYLDYCHLNPLLIKPFVDELMK